MKRGGRVTSRSDKAIAERVKALMDVRQLDQKDLATSLELSEGYISRILSGERPWPISLVFRAAEIFRTPVSEIDPMLEKVLLEDLRNIELRRDIPHLQVLHTFIRVLPKILDAQDLEALNQVLEAFARPNDTH